MKVYFRNLRPHNLQLVWVYFCKKQWFLNSDIWILCTAMWKGLQWNRIPHRMRVQDILRSNSHIIFGLAETQMPYQFSGQCSFLSRLHIFGNKSCDEVVWARYTGEQDDITSTLQKVFLSVGRPFENTLQMRRPTNCTIYSSFSHACKSNVFRSLYNLGLLILGPKSELSGISIRLLIQ